MGIRPGAMIGLSMILGACSSTVKPKERCYEVLSFGSYEVCVCVAEPQMGEDGLLGPFDWTFRSYVGQYLNRRCSYQRE